MLKICRVIILSLSTIFLMEQAVPQSSSAELVWPQLPQKTRVKHLRTISNLDEVASEKGFFSRVLSFLFGGMETRHGFVQPVGITVSPSGVIYISDPGAKCIHILNLDDKEYSVITETKIGRFQSPVGLAFASNGYLYISDSERKEILVLDDDLSLQFVIRNNFVRPTGIQIINGKLYIVDTGQNKIFVFDLSGNYISEFGKRGSGDGEFNYPVQLCAGNSMYIVDALNFRIQMCDASGKFMGQFGGVGNSGGSFANPKSIALDSEGHVYVTDALMDNFQIFDNNGVLLLVVGSKGSGDGEFMNPSGIAIDKNDTIYIVDSLNKRLQIFRYMK
ncbi:MAG: 6-bladed beta-propeller [Ignavibacteriales bacterium]|nr:6-bladed beta-propeller [Ignavibacteriales bacterium]